MSTGYVYVLVYNAVYIYTHKNCIINLIDTVNMYFISPNRTNNTIFWTVIRQSS